ncbi:MAG: TRAP transporter small permease [Lachnospiraceae bacterium]|nr:TRAP transporter small permease [Lachnospiraceae bacterium]
MKRVLDLTDKFIEYLMLLLISVMLIVGFAQVFCRYVLSNSLSWSEELMRFIYVWVIMIGINLGIRHKSLAAITALSDIIAKKSKIAAKTMSIVCLLVQLFVCVILSWYGYQYMVTAKQTSAAMLIPMKYVYVALPLGGFLGVIYTVESMISWAKGLKIGEDK